MYRALNHVDDEEDDTPAGGKKRKLNHANANNVDHVITTGGTKVLALPTGVVQCNKTISMLFDIVKPQIRQLVEYSNLVSSF